MAQIRISRLACAMIIVLLGSMGCMTGPHWKDAPKLPATNVDYASKKIVVSHFMSSKRAISVTQSARIQTMLEAAEVADVSGQIAQGLRERGIDAEARIDFFRGDLGVDQLLLSGAILGSDQYRRMGPFITGYLLTVGLLGLWGPSFLFDEQGTTYRYRVDLVDGDGRFLVSTGDKQMTGYYRSNHIFLGPSPDDQFQLGEVAQDRLIDSLAQMLSGNRLAEPSD